MSALVIKKNPNDPKLITGSSNGCDVRQNDIFFFIFLNFYSY